MVIEGKIVDIRRKRIFNGAITVSASVITDIVEKDDAPDHYVLPGFIDAHVHIESSMLVPSEFARMAVVHGTVSTVSDPHEIANVLGIDGVKFMMENGKATPFKFNFGAPSCVPATSFETAGAAITSEDVDALLQHPEIRYLAEMMNWPGVLNSDLEVMKKIASAKKHGKPVDGHAPGLIGEQAARYVQAGMTTDHECFTAEEALSKLKAGMKILIREGSAAKNFEALIELMHDHYENMMFCSDDKHPDNLEEGHINQLVARAVERKVDLFKVLQAACLNPVDHYRLPVGTLRKGDPADFIVVNDLKTFEVKATYINGQKVAEEGKSLIQPVPITTPNNFNVKPKQVFDFSVLSKGEKIRVIEALDGQLITNELIVDHPLTRQGKIVSDVQRDILKIAVVNRYNDSPPAIGFVKNFNLKKGAIASSVAHDSHNIIVVGVDDEAIARATNLIIEARGGICAVDLHGKEELLKLPVAGIMSSLDGHVVADAYKTIDLFAKELGCTLQSPFMTLSFMALLVIPSLKLSDKGLFNGASFQFQDLQL